MIELKNVTVQRDSVAVLSSVSLRFDDGRSTVVLGPSGCGKSLLLKVAAGLIVPDEGTVAVDGREYQELSPTEELAFRKSSGFVFQDAALWANMTIAENLSLPLRFHYRKMSDTEVRRRVDRVTAMVGFCDDVSRRPASLSTGEQKRISLARALVTEPSVVFLDSPTLSIDANGARLITELLKRVKAQERTIILSTHDPGLASLLADDLVVMDSGHVLTCGPFADVINSTDRSVINILTEVLSKASTFDGSILDLLSQTDEA